MGDRRRVSDWRMTVHVINIVFSWYHLKFNFWPECPIFTGTAGIVRYCPVFKTVRYNHVSVPVEWPVREISAGTVQYGINFPCIILLPQYWNSFANIVSNVLIELSTTIIVLSPHKKKKIYCIIFPFGFTFSYILSIFKWDCPNNAGTQEIINNDTL